MKRRSEHLVEKRDGRMEYLRATKLARSVHLALQSVGVQEDWRALEVTTAVLAGIRYRRDAAGAAGRMLSTQELAAAVTGVLCATGYDAAAVAFEATAQERERRRRALVLGRGSAIVNEGPAALPMRPARTNRLQGD
jgi:hypothetical protein